ncbi:MAG: glycosyltransferase family 39 protein [Acidobacteriota bacterium]
MAKHRLLTGAGFAGTVLILAGLLLPSRTVIQALRGTPPEALRQDLLLGAQLFKLGLVLLGCASLLLGRVWRRPGRAPLPQDRPQPRWTWALLGGMLLVSFGLRLYKLDTGLWHDEVATYINYASMSLGEIFSTYRDQNQHFLFSILARLAMQLFGDGSWSLRLPAVLFGVGSIWALYLFASKVTGRGEALLSTALLAFSYQHIWFSQNARGYTGLLFWTLLASWAFTTAQQRDSRRYWLLYAWFCALGVYTHMSMLFVLLGHFAGYAVAALRDPEKKHLKAHLGFLASLTVAGLLIFQLHALVLPQILHHGNEISTVPAWKNPLWALFEVASALRISFSSGIVVAAALAVFGLGIRDFAGRRREVIYFFVIPCVAIAAVVIGSGHHLWPRFFFFAFGFMCMIAVRGVFRAVATAAGLACLPVRRVPILQATACCFLVLFSAVSIPHAYTPKQDFLGALNYVQGELAEGDAVTTVGLAGFTYEKLYRKAWPGVQTLAQLDAIRARATRTWLIYTFPPEVRAVYPDIMAEVDRDFRTMRVFPGSVGSGDVFVCRFDSNRRVAARRGGS